MIFIKTYIGKKEKENVYSNAFKENVLTLQDILRVITFKM